MNKKIFYILIAVIFTLLSCGDNTPKMPYNYESISSLTLDLQGEIKQKTQLRLAFGKAVANALKYNEFRAFIKNKSLENTSEYFNELVFAIHKDDKVYGNKTLENYINEAVDKEIHALFGKDFVSVVLKDDPLVSIKIPDLFYNFDWDISKYSPIVYVKTFDPFGKNKEAYYVGYHYSGYQDKLLRYKKVNKYSIIIKYSEDYNLINKNSLLSKQQVHLFALVPQLNTKSWGKIENTILNLSNRYSLDNDWMFIKKIDLLNTYINTCEKKNPKYIDISNCDERCIRDCTDNINSYDVTFKSIKLNSDLTSSLIEHTRVLVENQEILVLYNSLDTNGSFTVLDKYLITGLRRDDFINREIKIKIDLIKENFEEIGFVSIPYIEFTESKNYKTININHLWEKGWNGDKLDIRDLEFYVIKREDILYNYRIGLGKKNDITNEVFTYYVDLGNEYIEYCTPPDDNFYFGNLFSISYQY